MSLTGRLLPDILPGKGTTEEIELINVVNHITKDFPAAFRFYGGEDNKQPHIFHCDVKSENAQICSDEECEFFRKFL